MVADALPPMVELLERTDFVIRSRRRADCAYCTGRSRGTVAFNDQVAFCHRCRWTGNRIALVRHLVCSHRLGNAAEAATRGPPQTWN